MKDNIILRDNGTSLQIFVEMESIIPCLRAIQQYKPNFKPQDIRQERWFDGRILDNVTEFFNDFLYTLIEKSGDKEIEVTSPKEADTSKIDSLLDSIELESLDLSDIEPIDITEQKQ